jgi:hypothetical protein
LALELDHARLAASEAQTAHHFPTGGLVGFFLQTTVKVNAALEQLRDVGVVAQLPNQAGSVKGRAAGQLLAFKHNHVPAAERSQMISGATTNNAAANDDDAGVSGKTRHSDRAMG